VSAEIMQFMQFLSQPRHDSNSKPRYKRYACRLAAAGYSEVEQLANAEAKDLTRQPQPGVAFAEMWPASGHRWNSCFSVTSSIAAKV